MDHDGPGAPNRRPHWDEKRVRASVRCQRREQQTVPCGMQDYRKLRVWRQAFALALNTRRATASFPRSGFAELKAQMISAAESIVLNIVEGCGAATPKELGRFLISRSNPRWSFKVSW